MPSRESLVVSLPITVKTSYGILAGIHQEEWNQTLWQDVYGKMKNSSSIVLCNTNSAVIPVFWFGLFK